MILRDHDHCDIRWKVLGCNCLGTALIDYWTEKLQSHERTKGSSGDRYPMETENSFADEWNDVYYNATIIL